MYLVKLDIEVFFYVYRRDIFNYSYVIIREGYCKESELYCDELL